MKKILSVVLALTMIVSTFTTVSAATINDLFVNEWATANPVYGDVMLDVAVAAKKNSDATYNTANLNLVDSALSSGIGVDYKATLNMQPVEDLVTAMLNEAFISSVLNDTTAESEFYAGSVDANISVKITYPDAAVVNNTALSAANIDNAAYTENGSRAFSSSGGNTIATINYKPANNSLTVNDLINNPGSLFDDINFVLNDAISYNTAGTYNVSVSMSGATTFTFASGANATIKFKTNPASHTVSASIPTPPSGGGGGGVISSPTVKFETNGGSAIETITVTSGNVIAELPIPTRKGYIFAGWYTDKALTTPFDSKSPIKISLTLYAAWTELHECRGIEEDHCPCLNFVDLDPTLWYHKGVDYVLNKGMMIGVETDVFAPDWDVTRAMIVTVLWRAEGTPGARISSFEDLEAGEYYVNAVHWAVANGIVVGYSDTEFGPKDAITREQFAAILHRYAMKKGYDVSVGENTNILSYTDFDSISEYAIPSLQYAVGSGLVKGRTESTLNPLDNTTRAEMATILYRFFTENN